MEAALERITSENRAGILKERLSKRQLDFISRLSDAEIVAIDGTEGIDEPIDYYLIARARLFLKKKPDLAKKYQRRYRVKDDYKLDFHLEELKWIEHEKKLMNFRLKRDPNNSELARDFLDNRNGDAFRIYFYFKFKDKIERC